MVPRWVCCPVLILFGVVMSACASTPRPALATRLTTTPAPRSSTPLMLPVPELTPIPPTSVSRGPLLRVTVAPITLPAIATSPPLPTFAPPATEVPTSIATRAPSPAPVLRVTRPTSAPTPTPPALAPGVYVTALRVDPPSPLRGQPITFYGKFVNTTDGPQSYNWLVMIYRSDLKRAFGETARVNITVPTGTAEFASANNWEVTGNGGCESYYAQPYFQDSQNHRNALNSTDGTTVSLGFQVCP